MARSTRRRLARNLKTRATKKSVKFEPVEFPRYVTAWWLQGIFFFPLAAWAIILLSRAQPTDVLAWIWGPLLGWAAMLSLHAAYCNFTHRRLSQRALWNHVAFMVIFLVASFMTALFLSAEK